MAKSTKTKKKTYTAEELKNRVWAAVLAKGLEGLDNLAYNDPLYAEVNKLRSSISIEVPAFKTTLEGITELQDAYGNEALEKALSDAVAMSSDIEKRFAYHEAEMERHGKMADALQAEMRNSVG